MAWARKYFDDTSVRPTREQTRGWPNVPDKVLSGAQPKPSLEFPRRFTSSMNILVRSGEK